jgi:hypothetical protein
MNQVDAEARRGNKTEQKVAEFRAFTAVLDFLDQLKIESFPLIRVWRSMADALNAPARGRGHPKISDDTKDLRAHALAAAKLLARGGMPPIEADQEIETRFKEAGIELPPSTLRNWRDDFRGNTTEAKRLRALLKEHEPSAAHKLALGDKPAHWMAAGGVLRELDFLLRLT